MRYFVRGTAAALCMLCPSPGGAENYPYAMHFSRGIAAINRLDYAAAEEEFKRASVEKPGDRDSRYYLGFSDSRAGMPEKAIPILEALVAENADDFESRRELGIACYYAGDPVRARGHLSAVIDRRPDDAECRYYLGLAWLSSGDLEKARPFLADAAARDPVYAPGGHYRMGLAHLGKKRTAEALSEFELAFRSDPESEEGLDAAALARSLGARGRAKRFSIEVNTRYEYDDNVVLAPDNGDILDVSDQGDFRFSTDTSLLFDLPVGELLTLHSRYRFFQSVHHHLGYFNLLGNDLSTGFDLALPWATLFAGYGYEYYFLDDCHQSYLRSNSLVSGLTIPETWWAFTRPYYRFRLDDFFLPGFTGPDSRDARNHTAGFDQYLMLAGDSSRWVRLGAAYERNNATGYNYTYNGLDLAAEFYTPLVGGIALDAIAGYSIRDYLKSSFNRYDDQQDYTITLSRELNEFMTVGLQYELVVNDSTVGLFQYQRDIYSLLASLRF